MEITILDNQIYEVKKELLNEWDEVFIDPILNPLKKYIFNIELEQKQGNKDNIFFFGLVKDSRKDSNSAFR